tara:strand:- start:8247 stop:8477 length:231 start_codon:yes stop_codon:yes gene_type:complete
MSKIVNINDYRPEDLVFHVGIAEINHKDGTKDYDVVIHQHFSGDQQMIRIPEDCILQTISALCEAGMTIAETKGKQ